AAMCASRRSAGVDVFADVSNSLTRINFEKICQIEGALSWIGKDRRRTARKRRARRLTPRRCIRLPPKRLPPKASVRTESWHAYRCSSTADEKSSCLRLNCLGRKQTLRHVSFEADNRHSFTSRPSEVTQRCCFC